MYVVPLVKPLKAAVVTPLATSTIVHASDPLRYSKPCRVIGSEPAVTVLDMVAEVEVIELADPVVTVGAVTIPVLNVWTAP